jgi:phospholipase C
MSALARRWSWTTAVAMAVPVATAVALTGCDPQKGHWGLDAITGMTTPADPADAGCGLTLPADTLQGQRLSCAFGTGALPAATLGVTPEVAAAIPIRHVIVMMQENRSFDHLFGHLHDRGQPGTEGIPASFTNPDLQGLAVAPFAATSTCLPDDPGHQYASMTSSVNGGAMDGFVKNAARTTPTDGHFVMATYDQPDLPFGYFLASTFALNDRHFAPVQSGTFANRNFLMFGSNVGAVDTGIVYPPPSTPSLLQLLMNAGVTWGAYADDFPFSSALGWTPGDPGVHTVQELYDALDHGTLPSVAFVDGVENVTDDHPTADLQAGEAWVKKLYEHAIASPQWDRLAILWTFDEGGGFADHVPPPAACLDVPGSPFHDRGPRVPLVAISPWARRNYVSHQPQDHTAITRFIATLFNLPALTPRDANSGALLDLFDFSCGRDLSVPAAPAPGTGGCAHD